MAEFTSGVENIRKDSPEWVTQKIKEELSSLQADITSNKKEMFYDVDSDEEGRETVTYNMDLVKKYLDTIKNLDWSEIQQKGSAWIMAIQIALESIKDEEGTSKYDVGTIDGMFGPKTKGAVLNFQKDNDLKFKNGEPDGLPGKVTIQALLEKLGGKGDIRGAVPVEATEHKENFEDIIKKLRLSENKSISVEDRNRHGLPLDVTVYNREGYEGYYYNQGGEIIFVPDLNTAHNIRFCTFKLDISDYRQKEKENWTHEYPPICDGGKAYLENMMIKMNDGKKEVNIFDGKYCVKSFNEVCLVDLETFEKGRVFRGNKQDLGKDIKMLDFSNYLVSRYKEMEKNKDKLGNPKFELRNGEVILKKEKSRLDYISETEGGGWHSDYRKIIEPFEKSIGKLDDSQGTLFCNYLNKRCGIEN